MRTHLQLFVLHWTATWHQPGLSLGCVDFFLVRTDGWTMLRYLEAAHCLKRISNEINVEWKKTSNIQIKPKTLIRNQNFNPNLVYKCFKWNWGIYQQALIQSCSNIRSRLRGPSKGKKTLKLSNIENLSFRIKNWI